MRIRSFAFILSTIGVAGCSHGGTTPARPAPVPPTRGTDLGVPSQQLGTRMVYEGDRRAANFPEGWPYKAGLASTFAPHAMIACDAPLAAQAGVEIMKRGGNAVDAAVAVAFAMAVVYPEAGNIGGGGYMVIRMADGRTAALDFREVAPAAATRDMYLDAQGNLTNKSVIGPLASGVPGSVAGLTTALATYGTLSLAEVMAPAIRDAEDGFTVDSAFAKSIATHARLLQAYGAGDVFLPGGQPLARGAKLVQPALARTLRRIAEQGAAGFYRGETARYVADNLQRSGGIITEQDLAAYKSIWREPVKSTYRGYTLFTMPPSSSGGVTITETLNILEGLPVLPFGTAEYAHDLASAYQRAFIDRNSRLGDPAFVDVPLAHLTDKAYAAQLRATIAPGHATPTAALEREMHDEPSPDRGPKSPIREGMETTHFSVADANGNAVATTTTLNALYGSGVYVDSAGFFLNDEMDDFAAAPGKPNMFGLVQGEANAIAPGKRMLSAMSPTIVLDRDGGLLLVVGCRGGPHIITSTSQVILDVLDQRMTLSDAMSAPRLHQQGLPDSLQVEPGGLRGEVVEALRGMGYGVETIRDAGLVNAVMRVRGGYEGKSDPRGAGGAVGY